MYFDRKLWRLTAGLRGRIAAAVVIVALVLFAALRWLNLREARE